MSAEFAFFDTNVLLYAYTGADSAKQARAKQLIWRHTRSASILISTQVIQEFCAVGARKFGMAPSDLSKFVEALAGLPLVIIGPGHVHTALSLQETYRLSFWDALIIAAATDGRAEILLTEDLNHGQRYGSVTVRNPFLIE